MITALYTCTAHLRIYERRSFSAVCWAPKTSKGYGRSYYAMQKGVSFIALQRPFTRATVVLYMWAKQSLAQVWGSKRSNSSTFQVSPIRNTHFRKIYLVPGLVHWYKLWAEDVSPLFVQVHFATPLTIRHQQSQIRITVQQLADEPTGQVPPSNISNHIKLARLKADPVPF